MLSRIVALLAVLPALVAAQAITESVIGSAKAAATTAPAAQAAGKAIGAGFEKLGEVLQDAAGATGAKPAAGPAQTKSAPASRTAVSRRRAAPSAAKPVPTPAITYEDAAGIKEGMEYDEVMRRFGPPAMKFTSGPGDELLTYASNDQSLDVKMVNGKVTGIQKTGGSDPVPAARQ